MRAVIFVLFWSFEIVFLRVSSSSVQINITEGKNVTLKCQASTNSPVSTVEWTRTDRGQEYVFLYRDGRADLTLQDPSFRNRVVLKDSEMKQGDVSLFMEEVMSTDTGTYACRVIQSETKRRKRSFFPSEPIKSIIYLNVQQPGDGAGDTEDGGADKIGGGDKNGGNKDSGGEDDGKTDGNSRGHIGTLITVLFASVMTTFIISVLIRTKSHRKNLHLSPSDEACDKHPA